MSDEFLSIALQTEHWLERGMKNEFLKFFDNSITNSLSLTNLACMSLLNHV